MTAKFRYKKWDGTQSAPDVSAGDCFEEFSKYLMEGWTPDEAYEWILKQGIGGKDEGTFGIDELRGELSSYRQDIFGTYNLGQSLEEIRSLLQRAIEKETARLKSVMTQETPELEEKLALLESLPEKLSQAIESLMYYDFTDPRARELYSSLLSKLKSIKDVEIFIHRMSEKFTGNNPIGFEETLEIMSILQKLDRVERMMISGDIGEIREEELKEVLSEKG